MKASKSGKERKKKAGKEWTALVPRQASDPALANAVSFWTDATTSGSSLRRPDIRRDKSNAVLSFFGFAGKHPVAVTPADVKAWQADMEGAGANDCLYADLPSLVVFQVGDEGFVARPISRIQPGQLRPPQSPEALPDSQRRVSDRGAGLRLAERRRSQGQG